MTRTLLVAVSAALLLTACARGDAPAPSPTPTAAANDRLGVLRVLRGIDTCALYGGARTVAGRELTVEGPKSFLGCAARTPDPGVETSIAVNVVGDPEPPRESWIKHRTIDGVDVTFASALDAPNAPAREEVSSWTCNYTARFPDKAVVVVQTSAPPEVDACAIGEELMRTAIREYAKRPQWSSNTGVKTVLTGADPCAVPERLRPAHRVDVDIANSTVNACFFTVDGSPPVDLSFGYTNPALLDNSTEEFTLSGHRVTGEPDRGVYDVVVGDEFQVADKRLIPVVTIVDLSKDTNRIRLVAQAVADEY